MESNVELKLKSNLEYNLESNFESNFGFNFNSKYFLALTLNIFPILSLIRYCLFNTSHIMSSIIQLLISVRLSSFPQYLIFTHILPARKNIIDNNAKYCPIFPFNPCSITSPIQYHHSLWCIVLSNY